MSNLNDILNNINIGKEEESELNQVFYKNNKIRVKIIGVGGAGCNIVNKFYTNNDNNIELLAINTDINSLERVNDGITKIAIGYETNKGRGAGGMPLIAKNAVIESSQFVTNSIKNVDCVILIGGLGKGTGSGAISEIAKICKQNNVLTICYAI
jgi:cell division protein FtsZ